MRRKVARLALGVLLVGVVGCEIPDPQSSDLLEAVWDDVESTSVSATVYDYTDSDATPDSEPTPDVPDDRYLTVYRSTSVSGTTPAVLYVHGGGWVSGRRDEINTPQGLGNLYGFGAALYAQVRDGRGWTVISVDYGFGGHRDGIDDVADALEWVKANATTLQIDPTEIVIAGTSAGGHIASMVALEPTGPPIVAGVVNLDGPNHLESLVGTAQSYTDAYLGCDVPPTGPGTGACSSGAIDGASPISHLNASDPAIYLACGAEDTGTSPTFLYSMCADHSAMYSESESVHGTANWAALDVVDGANHFTVDQGLNLTALEDFLDNMTS